MSMDPHMRAKGPCKGTVLSLLVGQGGAPKLEGLGYQA
jgi:hypothetical protein